MENKVRIEYKPKIWCEPSIMEEIEQLFNQVEEFLEEEGEKDKVAKATEEAKWKEQKEELQELLKKEGLSEEEVRSEVLEVVNNIFKQKKN